jgi:GNAT superfamily N-acetyltransferase
MEIRELTPGEFDEALGLAKRVFMEFEAPDYSEEGVRSFFGSLDDPGFVAMLRIYGAYDRGQLAEMLATRSGGGHIALFFVDSRHQGQGIGRKLFDLACKKRFQPDDRECFPLCQGNLPSPGLHRYRRRADYGWHPVYADGPSTEWRRRPFSRCPVARKRETSAEADCRQET